MRFSSRGRTFRLWRRYGISAVYDNSTNDFRNQPSILGYVPSSYETNRLIAEVLETKDPSRFKPTLKPNNHWINWPEAGALWRLTYKRLDSESLGHAVKRSPVNRHH